MTQTLDPQFEYYGRLFEVTPTLRQRRVTLSAFLAMPQRYIKEAFETERLQRIYEANPVLAQRGILFETFCLAPDEILQAVLLTPPANFDSDLPEPPLPEQRTAIARWKLAEAEREFAEARERELLAGRGARVRNGAYVEPLHHHSHRHCSEHRLGYTAR